MKLLPLSAFRASLRIDADMAGADATLAAALDNATERLASELGSTFTRKTDAVETFAIRAGAGFDMGVMGHKFSFALKTGILAITPVVQHARTLADLAATPETIDSSLIFADLEKGGVTVIGPNLRGRVVRMTYDAGFYLTGEADTYDVPADYGWLVEAAKSYATAEVLQKAPAMIVGEDTNHLDDKINQAVASAAATISAHTRNFANSIRAAA